MTNRGSVVNDSIAKYDVNSPLLCSKLTNEDIVSKKSAISCAILQKSFFD